MRRRVKPTPKASSASSTSPSTAQLVEAKITAASEPKSSEITDPGLAYFDFSELEHATLEDLSPFVELHRGFSLKISRVRSEEELRWVYEQVREKFMEMDSSHLDPSKHPVEAYFQTPDGKEFAGKLEELRQRAQAEDQENARWFSGEVQRLDLELRQATGKEERKRVLRRYFYQWKRIRESDYTDLRVRGAWEAYLDSPEGGRLLRRMDKEMQSLGLKNPEIPFTPMRRY